MDLIQVDLEKCTKCGIRSKVCPTGTIGMNEHGLKAVSENCITCGHCVAICPSGALDNVKTHYFYIWAVIAQSETACEKKYKNHCFLRFGIYYI